MKTVFITGGTGFVGSEIVKSLVNKGYMVKLLARDSSKAVTSSSVEIVAGDILKPETFIEGLKGVDCVINLVGIIREIKDRGVTFENMHFAATKNVVDAAIKNGVNRFIQMSANGTRENAVSQYHITKYKAEKYITESSLNYTIIRPSLIYGPKDAFINMLNNVMKMAPVFSYFGDGSYKMQPVSVFETAEVFVNAIDSEDTFKKLYSLCGSKVFTYKELLYKIMDVTGRKRVLIPVPEFIIDMSIAVMGGFSWFPITKDQFTMLREGNICGDNKIFTDTKSKMLDFDDVIRSYLK